MHLLSENQADKNILISFPITSRIIIMNLAQLMNNIRKKPGQEHGTKKLTCFVKWKNISAQAVNFYWLFFPKYFKLIKL